MHEKFDPAILKCKGQIRARVLPSPLHSIVVLNNEYDADVG